MTDAPATATAPDPVTPAEGLGVVHLFCRPTPLLDHEAVTRAVVEIGGREGVQVICVAMLGHKADIGFMVLGPDLWVHREFQTAIQRGGLDVVDSYVSLTEISEYAAGVPEEMRNMRLYPELTDLADKPAWCFYPMSKKRAQEANWFTTEFEKRKELMYEHGTSGRKFKGRILQVITGSTGIDDWEWGVTLFAQKPDDLKEVVYTMRFDEASALYAEFGAFYTGIVAPISDVLARTT